MAFPARADSGWRGCGPRRPGTPQPGIRAITPIPDGRSRPRRRSRPGRRSRCMRLFAETKSDVTPPGVPRGWRPAHLVAMLRDKPPQAALFIADHHQPLAVPVDLGDIARSGVLPASPGPTGLAPWRLRWPGPCLGSTTKGTNPAPRSDIVDGCGERNRLVTGEDDPFHAKERGGPEDRPGVVRILDVVQGDPQAARGVRGKQLRQPGSPAARGRPPRSHRSGPPLLGAGVPGGSQRRPGPVAVGVRRVRDRLPGVVGGFRVVRTSSTSAGRVCRTARTLCGFLRVEDMRRVCRARARSPDWGNLLSAVSREDAEPPQGARPIPRIANSQSPKSQRFRQPPPSRPALAGVSRDVVVLKLHDRLVDIEFPRSSAAVR